MSIRIKKMNKNIKKISIISILFLITLSIFSSINFSAAGNPSNLKIVLINNAKDYEAYGFKDLGIYYTPTALCEFHMPFAVPKKDSGILNKDDLSGNLLNTPSNLISRKPTLKYTILAENNNYYIIDYQMNIKASTSGFSVDFIPSIKTKSFSEFAWWDSDWKYKEEITIDSNLINSSETNFPFLVHNASNARLATYAQADGGDIVFTDSVETTTLPHELDYYNSATGNFSAWVNLDLTQDTTYTLYMYYGNSECADQEDIVNVWDENFLAVYHFSENSGDIVYDSTGNNNDSSYSGSMPTRSNSNTSFGYKQYFDGTGDWIYLPNKLHLSGQGSIMAVVQALRDPTDLNYVWNDKSDASNDISIWGYNDNSWHFTSTVPVGTPFNHGLGNIVDNAVYYLALSFNSSVTTHIESVDDAYYKDTGATSPDLPANSMQFIGTNQDHAYNFVGWMDEFRISSVPRTAEWQNMTYNTMFLDMLTFNEDWTPFDPTNVTANLYGNTAFNITWVAGEKADLTTLVRKSSSFPTTPIDGTVLQNSTKTYYNDTNYLTEHYYTLFSWNNHSSMHSEGVEVILGSLIIRVYDKNTTLPITDWSVFISNQDGSVIYNEDDCNNPHALANISIPYGNDTMIEITKDSYRSRIYYTDLKPDSETIYFNAYLPPKNISELYLLQVKNDIDLVVPDAKLTFKTYINDTAGFVNISTLITDGDGQVNIYLIPGDYYKIIIEATGYDIGISDYYPSDSIFTHTLRIYFSNGTGVPKEYLFDNIDWSITPTDPYHNTSIDVAYTINSDDGKLEWFNATVHEYNSSSETWVLLYAENITDQPTGGTIQYTINNETGKYSFTCRFKKEGFPVYTFGTEESCRIYYIYLPDRGWGIENIPSFIYMLITIVLMIGATGLLAMVGAGEVSGFGGMGVMAIMFTVNPSLLVGGISCWFVLLVAAIVYGAFLFVTKG